MPRILRNPTRLGRLFPSVGTMLLDRSRRFRGRAAYREKRDGAWRTLLWEQLHAEVARVGAGLLAAGLREGEVAAIYSRNREEMLLFELAAMSAGAIACPIFSEYPPGPLDAILAHAAPRFLAVSDAEHLRTVLAARATRAIERIYLMDQPGAPLPPAALGRVAPFAALRGPAPAGAAAAFHRRVRAARGSDPCLLMYTSGTTGRPKGVLLSHRNILSQRRAMELLWKLPPGGRVLAYLPWHHSFGGIFELFGTLYSGATLTRDESYGKDLRRLVANFRRVRPTVYFSVPRVHQALVEAAERSERARREIFHPELRFVFTAAAPLPAHVAARYAAARVPVVEGWGLTETSPCVTVTRPGDSPRPGRVGRPIPGCAIRLAADGEIQVRGPNVMLGYYKDPAATRRAFTRDGWFRTGDHGELRGGALVLQSRKDGMFKLSNGEMVFSQAVENALSASPLVQYALAVGAGRDFVGALIFPNRRAPAWGGPAGRRLRLLSEQLERAAQAVSPKYARPRAFVVLDGEPSLANGQLTPTLKLVRGKVLADHEDALRALFLERKKNGVLRL